MFGALGISLAPQVRKSRSLYKWIKPIADWYANQAGYRKVGFRYDDLLVEERPDVQRALERLTPREYYDRSFRFKRASQASVQHKTLPKDEWLDPKDDVRYIKNHIEDVMKEDEERAKWDAMSVTRK